MDSLALALLPAAAGGPIAAAVLHGHCRRRRLNAALHELRRPLQRLALAIDALPPTDRSRRLEAWLEQTSGALVELDRALNGAAGDRPPRRGVPIGELLAAAAARWQAEGVEVAVSTPAATIAGDRLALSRAIDNLVANALEHGGRPVRVEAAIEGGELRLEVVDGGRGAPVERSRGGGHRSEPRRGHGLAVVRGIARSHDGAAFGPRTQPGGAAGAPGTIAGLRVPGVGAR